MFSLFPMATASSRPTNNELLELLTPYPILHDFAHHNCVTTSLECSQYKFYLHFTLSTQLWTPVRRALEHDARSALPKLFRKLASNAIKIQPELQIVQDPYTDLSLRWQDDAFERGIFDNIQNLHAKSMREANLPKPKI